MNDVQQVMLPGLGSSVVFLLIIGVVLMGFAHFYMRSNPARMYRRFWGMMIAWLALTGALPLARQASPETALTILVIGFAIILGVTCYAAFSSFGKRMAVGVPMVLLIGIQAFRLPLELVLHHWWQIGFVPVQMTYSGDNYDILIGALALPMAWFAWRFAHLTWLIVGFHGLGLLMLLRILIIVALSNPTPLKAAFGGYETGIDVVIGLYFPYVWIVSVAVAGAIYFHLIGLRSAFARSSPQ